MDNRPDGQGGQISLPLVYVGAEEVPVLLANMFVSQFEQNEFILTVGQLVPPILIGTLEEREEQAKKVGYVAVKIVAKLGLTRQRVVELIQLLQENLRNYDTEQQRRG